MRLSLNGPRKISSPAGCLPQMLEACDHPKRRPDVSVRVVESETVIFDRQGGRIHQLNSTASFIWERCDGKSTVAGIVKQLAHEFDVDYDTATKDVVTIIGQLRQLNLLGSQ
jgi:Coenzyme PQQ synthesis protein D (PqqD)